MNISHNNVVAAVAYCTAGVLNIGCAALKCIRESQALVVCGLAFSNQLKALDILSHNMSER